MDGTKGERGKEARDEIGEIVSGCSGRGKDGLEVKCFSSVLFEQGDFHAEV